MRSSYLEVKPDPADVVAGPADLVDAGRGRRRRHRRLHQVRVVLARGRTARHLDCESEKGTLDGAVAQQDLILQMQQTPYPEAHVPELAPPRAVHSADV